MQSNTLLLYIQSDPHNGVDRLRDYLNQIGKIGVISKTSAIYKRYLNSRKDDLNAKIGIAVKFSSSQSLEEFWDFITRNESKETSAVLLAFNDEVKMSPRFPLPHPSVTTDSMILNCACEVWPEFFHPILKSQLKDLWKGFRPNEGIEFFSQAKALS